MQTSALPLGYAAFIKHEVSPFGGNLMERETRFELATTTLARWGSTTELLSHWDTKNIIPEKSKSMVIPKGHKRMLESLLST